MLITRRPRKLAKALLASGNDGLVLAATTGEAPLFPGRRNAHLYRGKNGGRDKATLIAYTGSNSTKEAVENTEKAEKIGVDACLSVVPYYNKPNQEGIYQHFKAVRNAPACRSSCITSRPRGGQYDPDTIVRLSQIKNIAGVKEANGDMGMSPRSLTTSGKGSRLEWQ